jgi:hypothetical protein
MVRILRGNDTLLFEGIMLIPAVKDEKSEFKLVSIILIY